MKKLLIKIWIGVLLSFILAPIAFADWTCDALNEPDDVKKEGYFVTILEEEVGKPTTTADTTGNTGSTVLQCFRVNVCKTEEQVDEDSTVLAIKTKCKSPTYASTCSPDDETTCQRVQAIFAQTGIGLLMAYIWLVYRWAATTIGIVCVVYIVWGGFMITTAQDDTSKMDKAKEKIVQSIAGLILLFLSAIILYTINPNFFTM